MKRHQARRGNGRFQRNTMANTFGLRADVCHACNRFITCPLEEPSPDLCPHCGAILVLCAHGRCTEAFPDPSVLRRGGYAECGKPAVACGIVRRWGQCEEHAEAPREHPTVGRLFRGPGGVVYRCTRWERRRGFWMRIVEGKRDDGRLETCISRHAILSTFYMVRGDSSYTDHEQPCECSVCVPDEGER